VAGSDRSIVIIAALIGLTGTLGAALIANWGALTSTVHPSPPPVRDTLISEAPHAPPLDLAQGVEVWGQDTRLLQLAPGAKITLYGKDLFSSQPTYPEGGCAGGGAAVAYTWQIRDPYPKGGDLQITAVVQGGTQNPVGQGSVGAGNMTVCDEHTFKNNGLDPLKVEVRYGSYAEPRAR
jgi:hypothetical protein